LQSADPLTIDRHVPLRDGNHPDFRRRGGTLLVFFTTGKWNQKSQRQKRWHPLELQIFYHAGAMLFWNRTFSKNYYRRKTQKSRS